MCTREGMSNLRNYFKLQLLNYSCYSNCIISRTIVPCLVIAHGYHFTSELYLCRFLFAHKPSALHRRKCTQISARFAAPNTP